MTPTTARREMEEHEVSTWIGKEDDPDKVLAARTVIYFNPTLVDSATVEKIVEEAACQVAEALCDDLNTGDRQ